MEFRKLRADEIDCRVGQINEKGCTLLLYKDARCDMAILDETVGPENWQRRHEVVNDNLFCSVGIFVRDIGVWVWKQDVGTESNTEKEKGEASDAFKRACVNWGIGRELYTAPFIYVSANNAAIGEKNGRFFLKDKLIVKEISYNEQGRIADLVIHNLSRNADAYTWHEAPKKTVAAGKSKATASAAETACLPAETREQLQKVLDENGIFLETIQNLYHVDSLDGLNQKKAENILAYIPDIKLTQRKSELKALLVEMGVTEAKACAVYEKKAIKDLTDRETEEVILQMQSIQKMKGGGK